MFIHLRTGAVPCGIYQLSTRVSFLACSSSNESPNGDFNWISGCYGCNMAIQMHVVGYERPMASSTSIQDHKRAKHDLLCVFLFSVRV